MQARDLDAPNLDTVRKPNGRSRPFLEDGPPTRAEDIRPRARKTVHLSVICHGIPSQHLGRPLSFSYFCFWFWPVSALHLCTMVQRASRLSRLKLLQNSNSSLNPWRLISLL